MTALATLHLHGVHGAGVVRALSRMALDRRPLATTEGLRFWKLLGTGHGRSFTARDANLGRWALFAVWESHDALDRFEEAGQVARAWRTMADESWRAELRPRRWSGRWSGHDPFGGLEFGPAPVAGPVAALTRARVRPGRWRAFSGAVPPVAVDVVGAPGLRLALGIGEAPVGLQATFSLWSDDAALQRFAYGTDAHREAMRRTKAEDWYAEELFARFDVLATRGTVDGRAP